MHVSAQLEVWGKMELIGEENKEDKSAVEEKCVEDKQMLCFRIISFGVSFLSFLSFSQKPNTMVIKSNNILISLQ